VYSTGGPVGVGQPFSADVIALDDSWNYARGFNGSVTIALATNPTGATLGGTLTVTAENGAAQFSDLTLDTPGTGYSLTVSSDGLMGGTTDPFNVQTMIETVGVGWGTHIAPLRTADDGERLLPDGRKTDLPWLAIQELQIGLAHAVELAAADVTVLGIGGIDYGPVILTGTGTGYTITLARPIDAADRVTIAIGNTLIAGFTRRLDVLPGDRNDDGVINSQDMVLVRNEMLGWIDPTRFGDINGDGVVDLNDYTAVRRRIGTHLS